MQPKTDPAHRSRSTSIGYGSRYLNDRLSWSRAIGQGLLALALAAALAIPIMAHAAESNRFVSQEDTVSLISKSESADGQVLRLGLLFRLSKGWHIYWKDAGDTGAPPELSLTQPASASSIVFGWPAPDWLITNGLGDYVLSGTILLPFTLNLTRAVPVGGVDVRGTARWLVCSATVCVPEQASFTLHLSRGSAAPSAESGLFVLAREAMPRPSPFKAAISPAGVLTVSAPGLGGSNVRSAHFFPSRPDAIVNAAPQPLDVRAAGFSLALKPLKWSPGTALAGVLEITDTAGNRQALTLAPQPAGPESDLSVRIFLLSVIGALIGGLLLNLMPCVFPVLAIKALSLARLGGDSTAAARAQALAYTAGVAVTMLAIGGILGILRGAGSQLGWGFQLQSPAFVTFSAWLVFVIGLNLVGAFAFGSRLTGIGSTLTSREGAIGSFATGLLAVVVATPCTAPFMGAAVAYALAIPQPLGLVIFLSLGVGMALPFLAIGFVPGLGMLLPRPGKWMEILRQILAFPMFATVIWLLWVIAQQAGPEGILVSLSGMMLLGFSVWLLRFQGRLVLVMRLAVAVGTLGLLPLITPAGADDAMLLPGAVPFSPARLAGLRAAGRPVLVDMSAAWCITCLINERVALENTGVQAALRAHGTIIMAGDWTNRDPAITAYLEAHHRGGVPLYVYYPPGGAASVMLPQILTPSIIRKALSYEAG